MRKQAILARLRQIAEQSQGIVSAAEARPEGEQALTAEEQQQIADLSAEHEQLKAELTALEASERIAAAATEPATPRQTQAQPPASPSPVEPNPQQAGPQPTHPQTITGGSPATQEDPCRGFPDLRRVRRLHRGCVQPGCARRG